jgi:hypothetical protein
VLCRACTGAPLPSSTVSTQPRSFPFTVGATKVPPDPSNEVVLSQVSPLVPNRLSVGELELELELLPDEPLLALPSAKAPMRSTMMRVVPELFLAMVRLRGGGPHFPIPAGQVPLPAVSVSRRFAPPQDPERDAGRHAHVE